VEFTMRFSSAATALWLGFLPVAVGFAADPPAPRPGDPAAATTPAASTPGTSAPSTSATPAPASDAAAKHAKRTACLKDAKAKKLVGADKTSFINTCIAAP
jgi:hypothetical protein